MEKSLACAWKSAAFVQSQGNTVENIIYRDDAAFMMAHACYTYNKIYADRTCMDVCI